MTGNILVVDDEPRIGAMLERTLRRAGYRAESCCQAGAGLERLKEEPFDVLITDLRMPGIDGIELMRRAKAVRPGCDVVLMTAHASVETAREALKRGAVDYITKPFSVDRELKPLLAQLLAGIPLEDARPGFTARPLPAAGGDAMFADIVGEAPSMQELFGKVRRIARCDASVLLQGESGTGKEVVASLIHRLSSRSAKPLVKINCAALPESLLESELFGHCRGAFTGATDDRDGLFQVADGGTLLLDEIGEISQSFQPKLLRVLQDGEFRRIGDSRRAIRVDVRVIAATNRNLAAAVERGEFRRDLYYRLNVVPLTIPQLSERGEDLPALVALFARRLAGAGRASRFSAEAMQVMRHYSWPGNVRELANAVEYAMVLCEGPEIGPRDLPVALQDYERMLGEREIARGSAARADAGTLEEIERRCILQAMRKTHFNRTRAAALLGVTRRTLGYRISKYALESELVRDRVEESLQRQPSLPNLGPAEAAVSRLSG